MYYGGNEIYKYLTEQGLNGRYFWTAGNMWTMLYSHQDGTPLLLCLISRVDREAELTQPATEEEIWAFRRFRVLARQAELPLLCLRFVEDGRPCEQFFCREAGSEAPGCILTSDQLLELLGSYGLSLLGKGQKKR